MIHEIPKYQIVIKEVFSEHFEVGKECNEISGKRSVTQLSLKMVISEPNGWWGGKCNQSIGISLTV